MRVGKDMAGMGVLQEILSHGVLVHFRKITNRAAEDSISRTLGVIGVKEIVGLKVVLHRLILGFEVGGVF